MSVLFVTGTDTDVGKTVTTAAMATALAAGGRSVAVYKPVQAGTDTRGDGDVDTVRRLTGLTTSLSVHEGVRLPEPMAPVAAATRAGVALPPAATHLDAIRDHAARHDHTLVEGSGGVLVHLDHDGTTLADLARGSEAVVVCRSGLGTLNHTDLTLEALARRSVTVAGLVIGSWPGTPAAVDVDNRRELSRRATLLGAIPERSGALDRDRFRALAPSWCDVGERVPRARTGLPGRNPPGDPTPRAAVSRP